MLLEMGIGPEIKLAHARSDSCTHTKIVWITISYANQHEGSNFSLYNRMNEQSMYEMEQLFGLIEMLKEQNENH